ncbi:D-alanyl-D-alanine carboxypeptidase family protein [Roseomonas elaeocarpi]|uniref:D-alanyl-D-alanine carboxypeptidase family protein n=1 Tax=Roseomonas elaeocarpi TaxID=907779 RepID=A0ABV6JTL4_9PROT
MREGSRAWRRSGIAACVLMAMAALGTTSARAQVGSARYASIVIDARSGNILEAANPDELRYPASLTKMMTLYLLFEALRDGRMTLDSRMVMSADAASQQPSKLGIPPGTSITAEQAILALVTLSANDVAYMIGESLGGDAYHFAQLMTQKARSIGMVNTTFRNPNGLPDPDQFSTARDMATLGRRLYIDFPDRYHYFSTQQFNFGGRRIRSHNHMVGTYDGVDGIKTGFISASGFNIVTSAQRQGQRLVAVVFGASTWSERDRHAAALLDQGFSQMGVEPSQPSPVLVSATAGLGRLITGRAEAATPGRAARRAARAALVARAAPVREAPAKLVRAAAQVRPLRGSRQLEQGDGGSFIRVTQQAARRASAKAAENRQARAAVRAAAAPARPAAARPTPVAAPGGKQGGVLRHPTGRR